MYVLVHVLQDNASNTSRHDGTQGTCHKGRNRNTRNIAGTGRSHLTQQRDLRSQTGGVGERTASKGGQQLSTLRDSFGKEASSLGVCETDKLVQDKLDAQHLGSGVDVGIGCAQQPGKGVEE